MYYLHIFLLLILASYFKSFTTISILTVSFLIQLFLPAKLTASVNYFNGSSII